MEEEAIDIPFGEAEMSLLILADDVPPSGKHMKHQPEADICARLASRFNVEELTDFSFDALLTPLDKDCLQATGHVQGRVRQICGVTLEPVWTEVKQSFSAEFQPADMVAKFIVPEDDFDTELPEAMYDGQADIGEMVTQIFAMEIPAYPRAEGAEFGGYGQSEEEIEAEDKQQSPFAALQALKPDGDDT